MGWGGGTDGVTGWKEEADRRRQGGREGERKVIWAFVRLSNLNVQEHYEPRWPAVTGGFPANI